MLLQEAHIYTLPPLLFSCPYLGSLCAAFLLPSAPSFIRGGCQFHYCDRFGTCQPLYLSAAAFHFHTCRPSCRGTAINVLGQLPAGAFSVIISLFILWLDIVSSFTLLRVQYYRRGLSKSALAGALCLFVSFLGVQPLRSR